MASNAAHKGVQLVPRKTALYLKWKDPRSGKYREQRLPDGISKKEAREAAIQKKHSLDAMKRRVATGELREVERGTDPLADWVQGLDNPRSKNNRELAARYLGELKLSMGGRDWSELRRADLLMLREIIHKDRSLAGSTKNKTLGLCKNFMSYLRKLGHQAFIDSQAIADCLGKFKQDEAKSGRLLTPIKLKQVFVHLAKSRPEFGLFFLLKFLTGARVGELVSIRGRDFTSEPGRLPTLRIRATKTSSSREVSLKASPLAALILTALKQHHGDGLLFWPEDRREEVLRYKGAQTHLRKQVAKHTGIEITPKDFRSSNEAYLSRSKPFLGQIFAVTANLGHSIEIAHANYQKQANLLDIPQGDSLEEMAGLQKLGLHLLKLNGFDVAEVQEWMKQRKLYQSFEEAEAEIEALIQMSPEGGIAREDHPELEHYWQAQDQAFLKHHKAWETLSDEEKRSQGYVKTGPNAWTHADELKRQQQG